MEVHTLEEKRKSMRHFMCHFMCHFMRHFMRHLVEVFYEKLRWPSWQNYSLVEQPVDILIKKLTKLSIIDININS